MFLFRVLLEECGQIDAGDGFAERLKLMVQNTLKKKARIFATEYGVPYLTALKAVDEPLHEMRDLVLDPIRIYSEKNSHFRLIGNKGIYSSAFDLPNSEYPLSYSYSKFLKDSGFPRFESSVKLLQEMGRRYEAFEAVSARDIWHYRELVRAGIAVEKDIPIDIKLHYIGVGFGLDSENFRFHCAQLGIFAVSVAKFVDLLIPSSMIAVTPQQLENLIGGVPVGRLQQPEPYGSGLSADRLVESKSYGSVLSSSALDLHPSAQGSPLILVFYKEGVQPKRQDFEALNLDMDDFLLEDTSGKVFRSELKGDDLVIYRDSKLFFFGNSERVIYM